jgi:hypothetical protein
MALTAQQLSDTRRWMGYAVVGTTITLSDNNDIVYGRFGMVTMSLYTRLHNLTAEEENTLINVYLNNLSTLEAAIIGVSDNLDTDQAAVWTHNKNEQADRDRLFDSWRMRLCGFIGFPAGAGFGSGSQASLVRG